MRLLVPEKFLDESTGSEEFVERDFDLERILAEAPLEVEFRPDENGFYLMNDALFIRYTKSGGVLHRDMLDLFFLTTQPMIELSGDNAWMPYLTMHKDAIKCDYIAEKIGSPFSAIFPIDGSIGDTVNIHKEPPLAYDSEDRSSMIGKPEWYEEGKRILKQAAEKYNVSEAYGKFRSWERAKAYDNFRAGVKGFLRKASKFLGFMSRGKTGF